MTHIKTLLYHCIDPENLTALLLGLTRIQTVNIGETTIHFAVAIKPKTRLLDLNHKFRPTLGNRLWEVKVLIIDELSLIFSNFWKKID